MEGALISLSLSLVLLLRLLLLLFSAADIVVVIVSASATATTTRHSGRPISHGCRRLKPSFIPQDCCPPLPPSD